MQKLRPSSENAQDEVRKCIKYFKEHQGRMRYAWFRKHNPLIGSGAIESVDAWVIQARCRLPGMRWSQDGVNAMLRLRCAWASGRFDEDLPWPLRLHHYADLCVMPTWVANALRDGAKVLTTSA
jgi:hypothetical protein